HTTVSASASRPARSATGKPSATTRPSRQARVRGGCVPIRLWGGALGATSQGRRVMVGSFPPAAGTDGNGAERPSRSVIRMTDRTQGGCTVRAYVALLRLPHAARLLGGTPLGRLPNGVGALAIV